MRKTISKTSGAVLFKRYLWLVDIISTFGPITLKDISEKWVNSSLNDEQMKLPRETFIHHKEAVQTMFDIEILCNSRHQYYIDEDGSDFEKNGIRRWMINSLSINGIVNENKNIKNLILFEDSYINNLFVRKIIEAVNDKVMLKVMYQKFGSGEQEYSAQPLCLKIFRQRWYLVCKVKGRDGIFTLGLERINDISKTDINFKPDTSFDPDTYFENYFGITVDHNILPQLIEVHVSERQADYLRTKPLHNSQEEKGRSGDRVVFRYYVAPTYEFEMEILKYSKELQVVSPPEFRERISGVLRGILEGYGGEN